ncbi:hypothetical protein PINS_up020410 [Pythium insidiosum]|nr:hypothetical protein PINS_up020410 [Pythium insidiosum]
MVTTSVLLAAAVPAFVIFYAHVVFFFSLRFQCVRRAVRAGLAQGSLALALGFERTLQFFVLAITFAYGRLMMSVVFLGRLPNLLLVLSLASNKELSDAFRKEQLRGLPDRVATLAALVGGGLVVSIALSSFIV